MDGASFPKNISEAKMPLAPAFAAASANFMCALNFQDRVECGIEN